MSLLYLVSCVLVFYGVPLRHAFRHIATANTTAEEYCPRFKL